MRTLLCTVALFAWAEIIAPPCSAQNSLYPDYVFRCYQQTQLITRVAAIDRMSYGMLHQARLNLRLQTALGPVVGYKAALTSEAAQSMFGVTHPVRGTLFEKMILRSPATLPATFGARPMYEADLVVRVSDESINSATSRVEVLESIDALFPFLELPDLMFDPSIKVTGPLIAAINAGGRYGVIGEPIVLIPDVDWESRLANFEVNMLDANDTTLATGTGSTIMGHPLEAVLWLRDSIRMEGGTLQAGDLLSLGTITPLLPVHEGTTIRATYDGLRPDGPVEVNVTFE